MKFLSVECAGQGTLAIPPTTGSESWVFLDVQDVSHFTIAGTDNGAQMQNLADWANGISGLNFSKPNRPYQDIPTLEYAVAFLNVALKLDLTKGKTTLSQAKSDPRLVSVKTSH